jgi:aminoglycoside phosphotransferase (APT) family kinase protein
MTTATASTVGLDEAAVAAWVLGLGLGLEAPLQFERIGNGHSNLTYRVIDAAASEFVLRRPPFGPLLPSAHDVAREHRILRALAPTSVPAPQVYGFTSDPAVSDVPLLLTEFVDGVVVDDRVLVHELDAPARSRLGLSLVQALARVHEADLAATGLEDLASHAPYAERQLRRWQRQWEMSRTGDLPPLDALTERLHAAAPAQRELALVHGDFHLLNVIVTPGGDAVRAILDWELCTLGDPIADLGTLIAYWPEPDGIDGLASRDELAEMYAAETGRDLAALPFWHALALWKIAIICEGVRRRALEHERNAPRTGIPSARVVEKLVDHASRVADEAGL